jgi:dTDP-4-amino-4,6-dideoxygalactose transaminase
MLIQVPLPRWRDLFNMVFKGARSDQQLVAPWSKKDQVAGLLSRSSWSLALLAIWRRKFSGKAAPNVWIPDYFCNSSLLQLRHTGANLVFYPVLASGFPNIQWCKLMVTEANAPDIFLLVHYFGLQSEGEGAKNFCSRYGAWLVEDAAHVLMPAGAIGNIGDFTMFSPHKHLAIPEGAVLVINPKGPSKIGGESVAAFGAPDTWKDQLDTIKEQLKAAVGVARYHPFIWLAKRLVQKLANYGSNGGAVPFDEQFSAARPPLLAPGISPISKRLLSPLLDQLPEETHQRRVNQMVLDQLVTTAFAVNPPETEAQGVRYRFTPYLAQYNQQESACRLNYQVLQKKGLPVTTWPDLPPDLDYRTEDHRMAWKLRHNRFYLPVFSGFNVRKVSRLLDARNSVAAYCNDINIAVVSSTAEWGSYLAKAGVSNLLQTWAYGAAKSASGRWRVQRLLFLQRQRPVAIAQVLYLQIGFLKICRINRGPLFLDTNPAVVAGVMQELGRRFCIRHCSILSISPELELGGQALVILENLRYIRRKAVPWASVVLDLRRDIADIRAALDSKWRNMLNFAERSGMELDCSFARERLEWMIERHRENMQLKNYEGPAPEFLEELGRAMEQETPMIVMTALHHGKRVAGICIAPHGNSSTYLLGWNSDEGRDLKANNFLLWNATVQLKDQGYLWFDLGGINENLTPGVSAFKLGMNGRRYENAGEFLKF